MIKLLLLITVSISLYSENLDYKIYNLESDLSFSGITYQKKDSRGNEKLIAVISGENKLTKSFDKPKALLAVLKLRRNKLKLDKLITANTNLKKDYKIDPEAVTLGKKKTYWIAEEKQSSFFKIDEDGVIRDHYLAGKDFSKDYNKAEDNKSFEGITNVGNNIYISMQSSISKLDENYIRILEFNKKKEKFKTIKYPIENKETKISDIQAIDKDNLLILEQSKIDNTYQQKVIKFNLQNEEKELLINLNNYNYPHYKAEGLVLFPDGIRVGILNDAIDSNTELWIFKLKSSLYIWGYKEYLLMAIVSSICLIFIFFFLKLLYYSFKND